MAACIHLAVERNTQGLPLSDAQRLNFFPASPLPTVTWIFEGELHQVDGPAAEPCASALVPLPRAMACGPHRRPVVSWSPGPVHALTVGFYPDAWSRLLGVKADDCIDSTLPLDRLPPSAARDALLGIQAPGPAPMHRLETALQALWQDGLRAPGWHDLRGWLRSMALRAAFTPTGAGVRRAQRRFKDWTGQSHRELALFARIEEAFSWTTRDRLDAHGPAAIAAHAGYSDQSHLGREVKRVTGMSPARFTERMHTDEAFWVYRLLGEHLRAAAG